MHKRLQTLFILLISHLIHPISFLSPRNEHVFVCIGWHRNKERELFADNAKYFYLYLHNNHPEIRAIWLAKDENLARILRTQGFRSYRTHSMRGIFYALRAKYTIIDARIGRENWKFSGGSTIVQLWHGKGFKKSGPDGKYNTNHSYFTDPGYFLKYKKIVATSERMSTLLSKTFSQPLSDIIITGHPRTDVFFKTINGADIDAHNELHSVIKTYRNNGIKKIFLYSPTFRADGSNPLEKLDLPALNAKLSLLNSVCLLSLHPKFAMKDIVQNNSLSHIRHISSGFDIYPYLKEIDTIITDYSNIFIDALLLDKPVIFFTYDKEFYKETTGLHEDFETLTPGPHVNTFDELLDTLTIEDTYSESRNRVKAELFEYIDGSSSERIFKNLCVSTEKPV